ncbi:low molecular weight phosphotyrosine protein phosphatase-like [Palaemon carinicauda]|uniref:low molecular weight phosphotyrosine protein phosphatase-like n=1 Tax=Palaemon carinicauda TaxID=392227 RepID=UPI0035B580E1
MRRQLCPWVEDGLKVMLEDEAGNICRSPTAEAVFNYVLKERGLEGWEVDSGAIGSWHVGLGPDRRAVNVMKRHNVPMSHKARQRPEMPIAISKGEISFCKSVMENPISHLIPFTSFGASAPFLMAQLGKDLNAPLGI